MVKMTCELQRVVRKAVREEMVGPTDKDDSYFLHLKENAILASREVN
jgi:hypothetical protein